MLINKVRLSELPAGTLATLEAFDPALVPVVRLMALGLRAGDQISVLAQTGTSEPVVICRGSMRIMIDARVKTLLTVGPAR